MRHPVPRKLPDFLAGYMEFCKGSESPASYHMWSALSTISSALQRKVSIQWGHSIIFPNMYICLIGPSGVRKAEPIVISRDLLSEIPGVVHVAESITKEALIKRMHSAFADFDKPKDTELELNAHSSVSVIAEEFAVFLGDSDTRFLADLTNWYDSRDKWTYETKHQGIHTVVGVCVNILASMAPDWIPSAIPMGAIGGGFTSRIIFIVEHKKSQVIVNPNLIGIDQELRNALVNDLTVINQLAGEFSFSPSALTRYTDWYGSEERKTAAGRPAIADPRFSGYVSRRATHIKKLCMVISAARADNLIITDEDFSRALQLITHAERSMPEVFGRVGLSIYAEQTSIVLEYVKNKRPRVAKSDVLRSLHRDIDERTLSIIESTLQIAKFIEVHHNSETGNTTYEWLG